MTSRFEPCPFCAEEPKLDVRIVNGQALAQVVCPRCGYAGPHASLPIYRDDRDLVASAAASAASTEWTRTLRAGQRGHCPRGHELSVDAHGDMRQATCHTCGWAAPRIVGGDDARALDVAYLCRWDAGPSSSRAALLDAIRTLADGVDRVYTAIVADDAGALDLLASVVRIARKLADGGNNAGGR